jgi:argininosuccinate lyase
MKAAAGAGYSTATDLADWLVRALNLPFRQAHHVTGSLVRMASERKVGLEKLTLEDMRKVEPKITGDVFGVLGVEKSVRSRASFGGTAPANVRAQARRWRARLDKEAAKAAASQ